MASIWIDKKFKNTLEDIAEGRAGGGEKPFKNFAFVSVFAAGLAYEKKLSKEYKMNAKNKSTEIRDSTLDQREYQKFINRLAVAHEGDLSVLAKNEEAKEKRFYIFQNYVNNGLKFFEDFRSKNPTDIDGVNSVTQLLIDQCSKYNIEFAGTELGEVDFD
tara:strand:- start:311 stop:790 length:480 start_codon:yes stop_codon:yes gene_type:complete